MSLSQRNLSALQKAGQAVHAAAEAIGSTVRSQAQNIVSNVASNPFGAESEQAFGQFRSLARLSQDLIAVEQQMQSLYAAALELARPEADVVMVQAARKSKIAAPKDPVQDVEAKPAKQAKAKRISKVKTEAKELPVSKRKSKKAETASTPKTPKPITLTANDGKLLQFLQGALKVDTWTGLTGVEMSKGAALPLGSVGVSLKKLLDMGAIKRGERGSYQIVTKD